jgi:5,6-dimethylbenzimidazole synthase
MAPSVGLSQPWRFVLVEDEGRRAAVVAEFERENTLAAATYDGAQQARYASLKLAGLREAPVHLLVCIEPDPQQGHRLGRRTQPETVRDSAVCAIENLWLAARALGLGVGWVSILEPARLRAALDVPSGWQWVGYLCIGWPVEEAEQPELESRGWEQRRPLSEVLFRR